MNEAPAVSVEMPTPASVIARAEALRERFSARCFWFWHPEYRVETLEAVESVITSLRRYGDRLAWHEAQQLRKCLSRISSAPSLM